MSDVMREALEKIAAIDANHGGWGWARDIAREALAQAEQHGEVVAEIIDGSLQWFIPHPTYVLPDKFRSGNWPLYTAPPAPAVPDDVAKDAARYRWLRDCSRIPGGFSDHHIVVCDESGEDVLWGSVLDRAIDAAMLAAAPEVKS